MNQMPPEKTIEEQHEDESQDHVSSASATKVLNVSVPASVYWHIRSCATESRMSVKDFMTHFCKTATPIPTPVDSSHSNTDSQSVNYSEPIQ